MFVCCCFVIGITILVCAAFRAQKERSPELKIPSKELNRYMGFVIERMKEKVNLVLCGKFSV